MFCASFLFYLERNFLFLIFFDAQQFNFENQSRERFDLVARFSCTVSKFLRDVKFPFRTYRHHSQCFCPTFDYLVSTESSRFVTFVRAVEFCSVDQSTFVVHFHFASVSRNFTFTFSDYFVLQTACSCFYTSLVLFSARNFSFSAL